MLIQNLEVTFAYGEAYIKTLKCDYVQISLELLGKVNEDVDFILHEDYENVRECIRLKVLLDRAETQWMIDFLKAKDKNDDDKVIDKIISHLKLTFLAKRPPLPQIVQQELLMAAEEMGEYF